MARKTRSAGPRTTTSDGEELGRLEADRETLREQARRTLGTSLSDEESKPPPFRRVLRETRAGWYPLIALGALAIVDDFQRSALLTLGPEVARALGIGKASIAGLAALKLLALSLATLAMAAYVQNRPRRGVVAIVTAFVWSIATLFTGFVAGFAGLAFIMLLDGISSGSVQAVHQPLLMDSYPPAARVRAISYHQGANIFTGVVSPLLVAALSGIFLLTWRGVFLGLGVVSLAAAFIAVRLRDPGFGRWDTGRLREMVRGTASGERSEVEERTQLGFFEIVRRVLLIPTPRRVFVAVAVVGVILVPFNTFFFFYLEERWGMGPGARGLFQAYLNGVQIGALLLFATRAERMFRNDPARLVKLSASLLLGFVAFITSGVFVSSFGAMAALFSVAFGLFAALTPALAVSILSIVPANMRTHTSALIYIYLALGGLAGTLLLGSADRRFGAAGAMLAVAIPAVVGAFVVRRAAVTVNADLDRMIDEIVEEEELRQMKAEGHDLPLLACRGIDFSYGRLQVLFDVSFTVDEAEMVALLGTNGAGKSTLLRVISGIGLPTRGSVRLDGADITYLDAERRLRLGIAQIPGRSMFEPMSVVENLRLFGFAHGRDRKSVEKGIEASFGAFPILGKRRNQQAQTLSGGEQQMLALSKSLILRPRVLLIDELSLGLAPAVVEMLLGMVKRINEAGTSVVLVEQSVNIALSLVDHAYFMEKGEIRFDGAADQLLKREDLLRAVFLRGAAEGRGSKTS